jgi:RNA polymerase sigma factor (sigma-70 family)
MLIARYAPNRKIIFSELKDLVSLRKNYDELKQTISTALCSLIILEYDDTKGASLDTFVSNNLKNRTIDELRSIKLLTRKKGGTKVADTQLGEDENIQIDAASTTGVPKYSVVSLDALHTNTDSDTARLLNIIADSTAIDPEHQIEEEDMLQAVQAALEKLSPAHQEIIRLYYLEDRSLGDIAKIQGVTYDAIAQRKGAAIKKLRSFLEREDFRISHGNMPRQHNKAKKL